MTAAPKYLRLLLAFSLLLGMSFSHGQMKTIGQSIGSLVYVDGMNVVENAVILLHTDDLIRLEAYDLHPYSKVDFKAVSPGLKTVTETFNSNHSGSMKEILFFPKARAKIRCQVKYLSKNGKKRKLLFTLKPA